MNLAINIAKVFGIESGINPETGEKANINSCQHEFQFIDCLGTFCKHCSVSYGKFCVNPKCAESDCSVHMIEFPDLCEEALTFKNVSEKMTDDIYRLYLGKR